MKNLFLLMLAFLATISARSQEDSYTPLVRESGEWVYFAPISKNTYKYVISGDSIVNGVAYKKVLRTGYHSIEEDEFTWSCPYVTTTHCLVREGNKRIYGRQVDWSDDDINRMMGELYNQETEEALLYDFNDLEKFYHDWLELFGYHHDGKIAEEATDTCLLVDRKCYNINYTLRHSVIEGIGAEYQKDGDVWCRPWRIKSSARNCHLVSYKNPQGVYEYFNTTLYEEMLKAQHDVNEDGNVNVGDLTIVINQINGLNQEKYRFIFGSVTEDNVFDSEDADSVINYILEEIKSPLDK